MDIPTPQLTTNHTTSPYLYRPRYQLCRNRSKIDATQNPYAPLRAHQFLVNGCNHHPAYSQSEWNHRTYSPEGA